MWYRRLAPILTVAVLTACAEPADEAAPEPDAAAQEAMASDQDAITAVADYWETHYNMQHPDMVASVYTDEAFVAPADGGMFEGREAIEGWLAESTAASPTIDITSQEVMVSGDWAVGMGTYAISVTPEGAEPMGYSGAYINAMEKVDGEWKIAGTMSNYDAPPAEEWEWNPAPEGDPPPDAPSHPEIIAAYEAAFNAGDAAAVAALYTDDAQVAFSNGPMLAGPAEVQASMAERITEGATIEIHEVGSQDLGGGLTGAGGWYAIMGPDGMVAQTGNWMNVMRAQPDGSQKIVWTLTNARPAGM